MPQLEDSPPMRQIVGLQNDGNGDSEHHDTLIVHGPALSHSASEVTADSDEKERLKKKYQNDAQFKSMASDLAETKMRLALVQAERDELEFALLMGGASDSRSGGS